MAGECGGGTTKAFERGKSMMQFSGERFLTDRAVRRGCILRASIAGALGFAAHTFAPIAHAQATESEAALMADGLVETITVSSSRIGRVGFEAPTPVSTIGADEIASKGPTTIGEVLNQMPAFGASRTPNTSGVNSLRGGMVTSNLRGLGSERTLVLVNGRRYVPSTAAGEVDLRNIPALLIDQLEVVTGGASAAWGSDAVAGVINFRLKDRIDGVQMTVQSGMSHEGDNEELRASFATGGTWADGQLSIVAGLDYMKNDGIGSQYQRDWGKHEVGLITNPNFATNGLPNFIISPNVRSSVMTPGGLIVSGPLRGTAFGPNGTTYQFQFGEVFGSNMIGGHSEGENPGLAAPMGTPLESLAGLARLDFELTDDTSLFAEFSASNAESGGVSQENRDVGNLVIRADNAYLPASVAADMAALGLPTITIGRVSNDVGKVRLRSDTTVYRGVLGVKGRLTDNWSWDAYYQYGRSKYELKVGPNNRRQQNWLLAVDAVEDPVTGSIVCRSTLTDPGNGCIPVNVFGDGSLVANDYVFGTAWYNLVMKQQVAAINVQGDLFSTWAGPVTAAFGVEYRKDSADATSDALSQAPQPNGSVGGWRLSNNLPLNGEVDVVEGYLETVVPLAAQMKGIEELELNAAVRHTDYSISGGVTTWKVGVNYRPTDSVRLRATRSRDIRAPSLEEFFAKGGNLNANIFDPVLGQSVQVRQIRDGTLELKPENADSWTAGVVFTPQSIPGLNLSADWFDIKIDGVIGTLGAPRIVNACFAGNTGLCDRIAFNPDGTVAYVVDQNRNLDAMRRSGVDFEASYNFRPSVISERLPGTVTVRLLATYLDNFSVIDDTGVHNRVGKLSNHQRVGGMAEWVGFADVTWRGDAWMFGLQSRYTHSGVFNPLLTEGAGSAGTINDNTVGSYVTFNTIAQRDFTFGNIDAEVYGIVNNLFDKAPAFVPSGDVGGLAESSTNAGIYDVIGRMYRLGVRFKF